MLLNEVLGGKKDHVSAVQQRREGLGALNLSKHLRFKVEMVFKDGTRRYYPCRASSKEDALAEASHFVDCIQKESGDSIAWRFTNEKNWHLGQVEIEKPLSNWEKMKRFLYEYFIDDWD